MEPANSPSTSLAEFYRFAFLLTGDAATAGDILVGALTETQAQRAQLGSRGKCHAWFLAAIRRQCLARAKRSEGEPAAGQSGHSTGSQAAMPDAETVAGQIHALAEPERSAVALFYLDLCGPEEIAGLLGMSLEEFSETLRHGRTRLQAAMEAARTTEPAV